MRWAALLALSGCAHGCGTSTAGAGSSTAELVLSAEDTQAEGTIALPTSGHESLVRLELPAGDHRPLRLRLMAGGPGRLQYTLYESTALDAPGAALHTGTREVGQSDVSDGRDGRWLVEDLRVARALSGVVWIGIRKVGGDVTIWASRGRGGGQVFLRNTDPTNTLGLMPVQRSPMVRLELAR